MPWTQRIARALVARRPDATLVAWRHFRPLVTHILKRALGSSDAAEDAAQEVFARFFSDIHKLRDPKAVRVFLITLASRVVGRELRRRRRIHDVQVEAPRFDIMAEQADPFSRHAFLRLCRLLMLLKERDRKVLLMCLVEQNHAHEAAELLGVSVPTIRRALARVRKRLTLWSEMDPFFRELAAIGRTQYGSTRPRRATTERPPQRHSSRSYAAISQPEGVIS